MVIQSEKYGETECVIQVERSTVDSFIADAYSHSLGRHLTDDEMDELQNEFAGEVQDYSWNNGSINHN